MVLLTLDSQKEMVYELVSMVVSSLSSLLSVSLVLSVFTGRDVKIKKIKVFGLK